MSSSKRRKFIRQQLEDYPYQNMSLKERAIHVHAEILHKKLFREEYNMMYDSYADSRDRSKGINPMNEAYQKRINRKRAKLGVSPLSPSGMPVDNSSMELCIAEQRARMAGKTTPYTEIIDDILIF